MFWMLVLEDLSCFPTLAFSPVRCVSLLATPLLMQTDQARPQKRRVLVVDDDAELTQIFQHLLEAYHYEVITAANGALALKQIVARDVDAILCDLKMPELEGDLFYGAVERIKPHLCRRFIFITGAADNPKYRVFLSQVKSPILRKPVVSANLLEELRRLLETQP
jgi:CheY-like chemotaxis protein